MKATRVWGCVFLLAAGIGAVGTTACNELTGADQFVESPCYPLPPSQCGDAGNDAAPDGSGDGPAVDSTVASDAGDGASDIGDGSSDVSHAEGGCPASTIECNGTCEAPRPQNGCGAGGLCGMACPTTDGGMATCNGTSCGILCMDSRVSCGGVCVDTSSDGQNCGSCRHDCLGGGCIGGICQPVTLAAAAGASAPSLVVDANNVYWNSNTLGSVFYCPKTGGCGNGETLYTVPTSYGNELLALATDNTNLYTVVNAVYFARITTNPPGGAFWKVSSPYVWSMAFDTVNAWVYLRGSTSIARVKPDGTQFTNFATVGAAAMAVDSQNLYLADADRVVACALTGTTCSMAPVMTVSGPSSVYSDGTSVWVASFNTTTNSGTISRCSVNKDCGASPDLFASYSGNIVVDNQNVYWSGTNATMRCPVAGCSGSPTVLAKEGGLLVQDSTAIYWLNSSLKKLAK
jgi:hypothetical protein